MDIVYFVKESKNNTELLYSLRSLANIAHDRVFVVGHKPQWCQNVIHIDVSDDGNKYNNVINKYKIVCDTDDISDDFIFMHDDIFILKNIKEVKYHIIGSLKEHYEIIERNIGRNHYYNAIKEVDNLFPGGDSFDVHCPIVLNKKKLKYIIEEYGLLKASKRSIYCNYYKIKGEKLVGHNDIGDCKISKIKNRSIGSDWEYLSTMDGLSTNKVFLNYMKKLFKGKSKYENALYSKKNTMIFVSKPKYAVQIGTKLVQFNSLGEYETDDEAIIAGLSNDEYVTSKGSVKEPQHNKQTELVDLDIGKLKEEYQAKFGKKPYHGRTAEQLQEKLS